jgi:hypothetical protein
MFDPQLLALAEGLLTPGRTGSFFEGLGTAAGKMRAAEELEEKRAQEIAQAQLGLAEKGLALQRARSNEEFAKQLMVSGMEGGAEPTGSVSDPTGLTAYRFDAPDTQSINQIKAAGIKEGLAPSAILKNIQDFIKDRTRTTEAGTWDLVRKTFTPTPSAKTADVVFEGNTYTVPEGIAVQANIFRQARQPSQADNLLRSFIESNRLKTSTQQAEAASAATARGAAGEGLGQVKVTYNGEEFEVPPRVAQRFNLAPNAVEAGKVLREHFNQVVSGAAPSGIAPTGAAPALPQAPSAAPSITPSLAPDTTPSVAPRVAPAVDRGAAPAGAPTSVAPALGVLSERQRKERDEASMMDVKARTEWNNKQRESIFALEKEAQSDELAVKQFIALANKPWAKNIYGITSNPDIMSAVINLGESSAGVRTTGGGGFTIGIPNLTEIVRNLSIPREAQPDARTFLQLVAEQQMRRTSLIKGAASDFDQRISGEAGINIKDTPETIIRKAELRLVRGNFDKEVAAYIRRTGITPYDLPDSPWYKRRLMQLDTDLLALQEGGQAVPVSQVPRPAGVGSNWTLKVDANGNKAWVSPDNKQFVEVK